jgi:triacylglycerol esterase/lipase EstA (alpha/beta hydrolase family)
VHNVHVITCEPVYGDIDDYAEQVHARIEEICTATGAAQVVLVGHSMGGLTARRYVQVHGPARVAKIITLGTPHHGAIHSHGGQGRNARQMRLDSRWLERLNVDEQGPAPVPIVSVMSYHDNIVAPQLSAQLGHATNVALHGIGHLELVFSKPVLARVLEEIEAAQRP